MKLLLESEILGCKGNIDGFQMDGRIHGWAFKELSGNLPIWLNYMEFKLETLEITKEPIPENISFARVNKSTGKIDSESKENIYFELFLDENIN